MEKANIVTGPKGALFPWIHTPIQTSRILKPIQINKPAEGIVVDFGSNLGLQTVSLDCKQDSNITLIHAEIMQHAGLPGLKNLTQNEFTQPTKKHKSNRCVICNGSPENSYMPRLTYHGFRFVEVHVGDSGVEITQDNIEMHHFHSAGKFISL